MRIHVVYVDFSGLHAWVTMRTTVWDNPDVQDARRDQGMLDPDGIDSSASTYYSHQSVTSTPDNGRDFRSEPTTPPNASQPTHFRSPTWMPLRLHESQPVITTQSHLLHDTPELGTSSLSSFGIGVDTGEPPRRTRNLPTPPDSVPKNDKESRFHYSSLFDVPPSPSSIAGSISSRAVSIVSTRIGVG
jgi:hypothetical protein